MRWIFVIDLLSGMINWPTSSRLIDVSILDESDIHFETEVRYWFGLSSAVLGSRSV